MKVLWNPRLWMLLVLAAAAVAIGACGDDEEESGSSATANGVDRAFVAEMVPHHESAVEMAKVAEEKAQHGEVKKLADAIVETQNAEIETMNALAAQMDKDGVEKGDLGMKMNEMDMSDMSMLENAKPFDREFIDMMIPHHQDAILMARMELEEGKSADAKKLAEAIIDAQSKEIDEMNDWRADWYGEMSPAGGVPAEGMEH
jgi:uncharacterized protein (DUF305 family)